jgi:hypothetical protein
MEGAGSKLYDQSMARKTTYLSFGAVRTGEAVDPFRFARSAYAV